MDTRALASPGTASRHAVLRPCRLCLRRLQPAAQSASRRCRASRLTCLATAGPPLALHVGDTTIAFPFSRENALNLNKAISGLIQTFAAKQNAERPKRWDIMEYVYKGEAGSGTPIEVLEVACNPNAYPSAFEAKVLVMLRTADGVKVSTEGRLSAIKSDVDAFLENNP